jgi:hypothetical protein
METSNLEEEVFVISTGVDDSNSVLGLRSGRGVVGHLGESPNEGD